MNKRFYFLMVLLLVAPWIAWGQSVWDGTTDTEWYGDGSASEFTINTAEELAGLAKLVNENTNFDNKTIYLGADIVLNENSENYENWGTAEPANEWTPIGKGNSGFLGTFNGNHHIIYGLYIKHNSNSGGTLGLFGKCGNVTNLNVSNSFIDVNVTESPKEKNSTIYIGGIVGGNGNFHNCSFNGLIVANITEGNITSLGIGGICGDPNNGTYNSHNTIESCSTNGEIRVSIEDVTLNGGLYYINGVGIAEEIIDSYNTADISVNIENVHSDFSFVGISGVGTSYDITSCYNTGNIIISGDNSGKEYPVIGIGGILGMGGSSIEYSYNTGLITKKDWKGSIYAGNILGLDQLDPAYPDYAFVFTKNYYLHQQGISSVGGNYYDPSASYDDEEGLISATPEQFSSGEVAWLLRDEGGYGQALDEDGEAIDATPVLLAFSENQGKEVYQLTLKSEEITEINGEPIYRNAEECNLLPTATYDKIMEDADPGQDLVWTNEKTGEVVAYGNTYTPTEDATLTATLETVYTITTKVEPVDAGTITVSKEKAQEGDEISVIVTANEGYKQATLTGATFTQKEDGSYTFTMPAENVTITATFKKIETGDSEDEDYDGDLTKRYRLYLADQDFYQNDEYDEEGLVLYSRHDKKYTGTGGSFTIYYEKDGEMNAGDYRIFWSKSANGEYKEVKLDEVSGYYQIRNVQSDVYVKIYGRDGFPVSNEAIEATEARAYAQANKIIVVTHEPMDVQIVSMAGAVVGNAKVAGQQEFGNLAEGVYMVRLGDTVVKLQVRN